MSDQKRLSRPVFWLCKSVIFEAVIGSGEAKLGVVLRRAVCGAVSELKSVQKLTKG